MRRLLLSLSVVTACLAVAQPAEAQLKYGLQGALLTGLDEVNTLDGTIGIGPRVALQPPLLPVGVVGQAVYYFPEGDLSYLTYSLAAQLRLPLPMVNPYVIGGWQWRRASANDVSNTESGAMLGVGVQLNLAVALFLEGTVEFNDAPSGADADNSIVIKGGFLLGS